MHETRFPVPPQRPVLITLGLWLSTIMGGLCGIALIGAAAGVGQFSVGEESVSGHEFLVEAGAPFAVFAGILLAIGFAIWRERPWSRYLMITFWLSIGAVQTAQFFLGNGERQLDLTWLPAVAIAAWYLFLKRNVVAYFRALEQTRDTHAAAPAA